LYYFILYINNVNLNFHVCLNSCLILLNIYKYPGNNPDICIYKLIHYHFKIGQIFCIHHCPFWIQNFSLNHEAFHHYPS